MPPSLSSVDNALRLVHVLSQRDEVGVAEAGRLLGVARSTAHRLLASLVVHGFAEQDPARRTYRAGPALRESGLAVLRRYDVRDHARPYLEGVSERTGETTHLLVLAGADSLFVDGVEGSRSVRTTTRQGASFPAHSTSGGKALLAELSHDELQALYPDERLPALTARTIAARSELEAELDRIRAQGYARNDGESDDHITSAAAVVRDRAGLARFAISVSAPAFRADEATMDALIEAVTEACARATRPDGSARRAP
ncbi:IclR family transcriptional regulator [Capillimicrobium parvum]|uniref:HTH-type transcriptional regulator XynR n=1 Tax=Capillimicrobium parvum TaxID=2884022 RepID=A0A9E6XW77_9ACTN|nr:IclR family transcriptional regulator [Capillimicrobium parvum]UGS35591.1 HTH-type transcriptional regulator XynR [Capillimicrobium parvum]